MDNIVFTDKTYHPERLYPFSLLHAPQDLPVGIFSIRQKWEQILSTMSMPNSTEKANTLYVENNLLPTDELVTKISALQPGQQLVEAETNIVLAFLGKCDCDIAPLQIDGNLVRKIQYAWDLNRNTADGISADLHFLKNEKKFQPIDQSNHTICAENIFIEEGAIVRHVFMNAEEGPVYIAKGALVMEGSCLRGPVFIGEGTVIKMGTKIYGATHVGVKCTVGGEIKNTIFLGYANKAHDGYLGDALIGHWCNIGGGTTASNVKNTAGNIIVNLQGQKVDAGNKCGVLMGDYTRTAVNSSINSGTVIGICANVFGTGLTPKFIPSFAWGYGKDAPVYRLKDALMHIERWMMMKNIVMTDFHKQQIIDIYQQTINKSLIQ